MQNKEQMENEKPQVWEAEVVFETALGMPGPLGEESWGIFLLGRDCLLYTSDAADDWLVV